MDTTVDRARDYVDAHLRERIALRDVAAAAGVTPTRLRADLRRHTGETFVGLVRRRRVAAALALLATSLPLGQIAAECGFCDQSHFTRAFRRVHGVCPSRYRKGSRESAPHPSPLPAPPPTTRGERGLAMRGCP